jgi:adenosylmethionine-8-amino-7-oxononanoate aminotransferase
MRTEELVAYDREHLLHGLAPAKSNMGFIVESADGVWLSDTDGKKYMDLSAQAINVNLGHNRRDVIEVANKQMDKLMFTFTLRGFANLPSVQLAQKLATILPPGLDHYVFTQSGAETVDAAFRVANLYWKAKGLRKYKLVSLAMSYHGTSRGVATATNLGKGMIEEMPAAPGHIHIPNYYCYRCAFDKTYPNCGIQCAKFLEYMIETEGKDSVAAFIAESEQGASGFIAPPPEYFPIVQDICRKHNVLFIADEVMTGFCRTGKMFAIEHWNVKPDMMCMSKGLVTGYLPLGALAVSGEIFNALAGSYFPVGSTESGNPVCCAIGVKCIDIYVKERIADHVADLGAKARKRMESEFMALPHVGAVDGLGLMLSVEVVSDKESKGKPNAKIADIMLRRGVEQGALLRVTGNRLGFSPPLTITEQECKQGLDILYTVLKSLKPEDLKP